jgi:murein DD-endopeptidase MepM/ murein hydrolase activator NlpD
MQIMITHGSMARTRWQVGVALAGLVTLLVLLSGTVYHFVFLKAVHEGWPLVSSLVQPIVQDELAQRERFMRDNLDAMAQKVGEMQARLVKLEVMGERVSGMAGVNPGELRPPGAANGAKAAQDGKGGPYLPLPRASLPELNAALEQLDLRADSGGDLFTLIESHLLESRLQSLLVPSIAPVDGPVGSGFGVRADPVTGRAALHTGLDFRADAGTPIAAAAGGVVQSTEWHPQYGHMVEIDHGRGLSTRYAHTSKVLVRLGDVVKRGQHVADVGSTGRSTGPHLHFEVLVDGVPQDPARFLAAAKAPSVSSLVRRPG